MAETTIIPNLRTARLLLRLLRPDDSEDFAALNAAPGAPASRTA
jgi:hypothetical protein